MTTSRLSFSRSSAAMEFGNSDRDVMIVYLASREAMAVQCSGVKHAGNSRRGRSVVISKKSLTPHLASSLAPAKRY